MVIFNILYMAIKGINLGILPDFQNVPGFCFWDLEYHRRYYLIGIVVAAYDQNHSNVKQETGGRVTGPGAATNPQIRRTLEKVKQ